MYSVKFFPDEAKHALRKMPDIDSIDNDECLRLSLLFGFLEEDRTWVQNDDVQNLQHYLKLVKERFDLYVRGLNVIVRDQPSETILGPAAMSALLNNVRPKTEKEQADEGGGLQSEAKTLETSITEPARRAKLAELLQQFLDQSAEQIKPLKEAIKQPRPNIEATTLSSILSSIFATKPVDERRHSGEKGKKYERRFYEFLIPDSSTDRDKEWKKLRQLKMDPKLYHSLVATVQHMVERHGAKEPEYSEFWWPPTVYDPEPQKPKPGTEAETEEYKCFKRKHPKIVEDWEKGIAEREKKRKEEDEAVSKRFEERRNERKTLAERIEERENKRQNAQAEAIESIKRRYQNGHGSLVRDVGLEPRCRQEVQWNHCPQCRVYGRTPFLEWCDDDLCERANLIERSKQAKEAK
ncbi:hypothetical protein R1sor_005334 [Riccia sorocarpa]|uniref:Uncharacterized protein n=1 Tax=Riccia sorocarpa TaxID=122646 RepID=A0ABD3HJ90_9MARC